MSKKVSLGIAIALILISISATFAITMSVSMKIYNNLIKDLPGRSQMYSKLAEIDDLVRAEYYGNIDENFLNSYLAAGYIIGINDEYSRYMTADDYIEYYTEIQGKMSGIGILPSLNQQDGTILAQEVYSDSPAHLAGMKKGDVITEIEGEKVTNTNYNEMVERLEGDKLTSVSVTFFSASEDKSITTNIAKGYNAQSVFYNFTGSTGYIRITGFYENTKKQFENAIKELETQEVNGLIIDVRNNNSGSISYAADVIDVLVPLATEGIGAIATAVNGKGDIIEVFAADAASVTLPMVVLVNQNSAGGAELLACVLRDFGKAQIVGETTKGKGTLQKIFRLNDGSAVLLTVGKIMPYISESFNEVGVVPDYNVELTIDQLQQIWQMDQSEDPQFLKAYSLLTDE